jgi:hypothetical protein
MPAKKKKGKAKRAFKASGGVRPTPSAAPSLKEEVEPARDISTARAGAPLARPSRTRGGTESVNVVILQHQYVLKELKRIGFISGSMFLILIVLSFLLS